MPQTIKLNSPLKGVNRAFGREAQPDNTCYDALNVLPTDRYGRLRVAQRSGIGSLLTLSANNPVRLLHVATSARTGIGQATLFHDKFSYADGNLGTVATGVWEVATGTLGDTVFDQTPAVAGIKTKGSAAYQASASPTGASMRYVGTALALGSVYHIRYTIKANTVNAGFSQNIRLYTRLAASTTFSPTGTVALVIAFDTTSGVTLCRMEKTGSGVIAGTSVSPAAGTYPMTADIVVDLRVAGNVYTGSINGVVINTATNTTNPSNVGFGMVLGMHPAATPLGNINDFLVINGDPATNIDKTTLQLVAVSGSQTFIGDPTTMPAVSNSGTYPISTDSPYVSAATLFNYTYIVDGEEIRSLNLDSQEFEAFTESAGTAPKDCTIACNWRGRLILAGGPSDPQNFFASRAGVPLDWDTSQTDPSAAFAGNTAAAGRIGSPIHALIPMSDDVLVIGLEQAIYVVRGDPTDGGSIDLLSDNAGIMSATSWAKGPNGSLYVVGPRGFYQIAPTGVSITEIGGTLYPQFFQAIDRSVNYITMMYDPDRFGVWIFTTPIDNQTAGVHIFYDTRVQGLWPQAFTNAASAGPITAIHWDGYETDTRYPVLGGRDGQLYGMNLTNRSDNGGSINSYVMLGPVKPSDVESTLIGTTINFGELSAADFSTPSRWNSNVSLYAGKSAFNVTEGATPNVTGIATWGAMGRTKTMRQRLRGEWFVIKLSNSSSSNYFSFESADLEFNTVGRNRRQGV